jgi:hypothetical protein
MDRLVRLHELASVSILFDGDFRLLAAFLLRGFDSLNEGTNGRSRPTMNGVAGAYARLFLQVRSEAITAKLREMGFDLGAIVEWDEEIQSAMLAPKPRGTET